MKLNFIRPLGIAAIPLLCVVFCQAQSKIDTIKVIIQYIDTGRIMGNIWPSFKYDSALTAKRLHDDTTKSLYSNYVMYGKRTYDTTWYQPDFNFRWKFGYEVRSCFYICCDPKENQMAKYYWDCNHVEYLDDTKRPLPKNVIVWQSMSAK